METTKAQVATRLGSELPHSTVLDEIPRSPHTPNKNVFLEAMEDVVFGSVSLFSVELKVLPEFH